MENLAEQRKARRISARLFAYNCDIPLERYLLIEQGTFEPDALERATIQKLLDSNPVNQEWYESPHFLSDAEKSVLRWNDKVRHLNQEKGT